MSPPQRFRPVTGPDPGPQAALEVLAISVHLHGWKTSSQVHTRPWRPMTGMRQAVCKRTAGGASPESRQSSWGLRAAVSHSRSHRGPPASAGLGGARVVGRDSGSWCRQTRIPGGESPVKSLVTVLAPGFTGSKSCCSHLQDRSLGTELSSSVDLTLATVFTGHLPALLVSGGGD